MENDENILEELFVDEEQVNNKKDLFAMIAPYSLISKQTNELIPKDSYFSLKIMQKILIFLLVKKVLYLNKKIETDHIKAKDMIDEMEIPKGSILPNLKTLREMSLVSNNNDGYYITGYQVTKIKSKGILQIDEEK